MEKIKVAIVGAGNIAQSAHLPAYQLRNDIEITGIADLNLARAEEAAKKFGIPKAFSSIEEMLEKVECDYVDVCVWNRSHAPCVIAAAKAGKHILCEKPMADTLENALKMKKAVEEAGVIFMLAVPTRYSSEAQYARELLDTGKLGDVYFAKTAYTRRRGTPFGWFTDTEKSGGGPVIDIGVHCIDRTWYLMGNPKPVRISAATSYAIGNFDTKGVDRWTALDSDLTAFNTEDSASGIIHFENGASMLFEVSWAQNGPGESFTQVFGSKAGFKLDPLTVYGEELKYLTDNQPSLPKVNLFSAEIEHFLTCLRTGLKPISDLEQAVNMQRILQGIYDSARLHKEVEI